MPTVRPIPILADNYAWLLTAETGEVAVVDPAEAAPIDRVLQAEGGRLDLILLTHHHADHVAAAEPLRARYGARVAGAKADRHRLPRLDLELADGDQVALGAAHAAVLETPGHTIGHISYYFPAEPPAPPVLLCGDTLFSLGCGRLLEGDAAQMFASLRKFAALPPETLVCCGHEYTAANARFALTAEPDNQALQARAREVARLRAAAAPTLPARLGDELAANPFLRAPDAARLADLRARKDRF